MVLPLLTDIYNNPRAIKGQAYVQLRRDPNGPPTIFSSLNKAEHRAKQRITGPILNESSMRTFEPELSRQVDSFLLELLRSSRQREIVNASDRCERLGFDIMGQLAFSYQINTQGDDAHRGLIKGIKARANRNSVYFFFPGLRMFDFLFNIAGASGVGRFYKSLKTIIEARMKLPKDAKRDFYALASEQMGPGLSSKDLLGEAIFFLAAGTWEDFRHSPLPCAVCEIEADRHVPGGATTATATSGIFFYLSRNPEAYSRLASEIRTTFASGADIHPGAQLNGCQYLHAVVEESMRMSPSVLEYMWRQQDPASAAAGEAFIVQGHIIPPCTQVATSQYSIQHDETIFPEPYKFQPERWLAPAKNNSLAESAEHRDALTARRRAFAPFSIGERACAGRSMAWLEMRLTIARTLWYFDFERAPGKAGELGAGWEGRTDGRGRVDEFQLYDNVVVEHTGPNLVFTPRGDCWKELEERVKA